MKRSLVLVGLVMLVVVFILGGCLIDTNKIAPNNLSAVVVDNGDGTYFVVLSWKDNSRGEDGFLLERTEIQDNWDSAVSFNLGPNSISFEDKTVENARTYWYRVAAVWNSHEIRRLPEEVVKVAIPGDPGVLPPEAPVISALLVDGNVQIDWTDVEGEDDYLIERTIAGNDWSSAISWVGPADSIGMIDTTVVEGTTYWYRVTARNAGGSSTSNVAEIYVEPAENPEATVFLDTVAQDGRSVRQILEDEGFAVNFGVEPPNVEGVYDAEENWSTGGSVILEITISNQSGTSVDYVRDYGFFTLSFPSTLITGMGDQATLWYIDGDGVVYVDNWNTSSSVITAEGISIPTTTAGSFYTWTGIYTPQ